MAKEQTRSPPKADREPSEQAAVQSPQASRWEALFTRKRLATLLAASLVVHVAVFAYYGFRSTRGDAEQQPEAEVALGSYCYQGDRVEGGRVARADFALYAALADVHDSRARSLLADHKYRIQQGVEELLRRAHAGDFEDPVLRDLKRRLQDRIEETVGERVVAGVMVTNLKVRWNAPEAKSTATAEATEAVPWTEKPAG